MKRLAPGVYDDGNGGLHLDMSELLRARGYADTPENREQLAKAFRDHCDGEHIPFHVSDEPIETATCEECDGRGKILDGPANVLDGRPYWVTCPACGGRK